MRSTNAKGITRVQKTTKLTSILDITNNNGRHGGFSWDCKIFLNEHQKY